MKARINEGEKVQRTYPEGASEREVIGNALVEGAGRELETRETGEGATIIDWRNSVGFDFDKHGNLVEFWRED